MQTAEVRPEPQFAGSDEDQQIAREIFRAMSGMGRFFARSAPIRASVESLGGYMASRDKSRSAEAWSGEIARVLSLNPTVFDVEEVSDQAIASTTQSGRAPSAQALNDREHTLANRFMEPRPARPRARPAADRRARPRPTPGMEIAQPSVSPEFEEALIEDEIASLESVFAPVEQVEQSSEVVPAEAAPEAEVLELGAADDAALARAITQRLRQEITVANFGEQWMIEDKVPRLSRGDLRRIKDYLEEQNSPLTDETLLQDILGVRPGSDNHELMQFAVNYRLSREPREYEFVGTPGQRFWSTSGLPSIGTTKRKPSEIGQDYRFLLEERPEELDRSETVVDHVLTFYEYQYGVLPLNGVFEALFPAAMLADQRAAVLQFESPQNHETFFVELRFPTGNRGGYVAGFDRFFLENLVPGALITVERGDNDGRYLIEFLPVSGLDRKLLQYDDKKNRYVFRPMTFYCATQDEMLLTENRFPHLANITPLDERSRRRPEMVLAASFERIGEQVGSGSQRRYMALLDDLIAAANIERPMSAELIRSIIRAGERSGFSTDPDVQDVFYYEPPSE
jgi:hypothetical protein